MAGLNPWDKNARKVLDVVPAPFSPNKSSYIQNNIKEVQQETPIIPPPAPVISSIPSNYLAPTIDPEPVNPPISKSAATPYLKAAANYDKEFEKDQIQKLKQLEDNPNSFLDAINPPARVIIQKYSLANRLIWFLSFICILATVMFYFFSIQPTALKVSYNSTNSRLDNLAKVYGEAITKTRNLQMDLDKSFNQTPISSDCTSQADLSTENIKNEDFTTLKVDHFTPPQALSVPNNDDDYFRYGYFVTSYNGLYTTYQDSIKEISQTVDNFSYLPSLIEYKNSLIQVCKEIKKSGFSLRSIQDNCAVLLAKRDSTIQSFLALEIPENSKVSTNVANSSKACNTLPTGKPIATLTRWNEGFDKDYKEFMSSKIALNGFLSNVEDQETIFKQKLEFTKSVIDKDFQRKSNDITSFYILQPNWKAIPLTKSITGS